MVESAVANEGWVHVPEGSTVNYQHNPPASGPHYPVWLRYQVYTTPQARPYSVHNVLGVRGYTIDGEPVAFGGAALLAAALLGMVTLAASSLPARRASRLDPATVLAE